MIGVTVTRRVVRTAATRWVPIAGAARRVTRTRTRCRSPDAAQLLIRTWAASIPNSGRQPAVRTMNCTPACGARARLRLRSAGMRPLQHCRCRTVPDRQATRWVKSRELVDVRWGWCRAGEGPAIGEPHR